MQSYQPYHRHALLPHLSERATVSIAGVRNTLHHVYRRHSGMLHVCPRLLPFRQHAGADGDHDDNDGGDDDHDDDGDHDDIDDGDDHGDANHGDDDDGDDDDYHDHDDDKDDDGDDDHDDHDDDG